MRDQPTNCNLSTFFLKSSKFLYTMDDGGRVTMDVDSPTSVTCRFSTLLEVLGPLSNDFLGSYRVGIDPGSNHYPTHWASGCKQTNDVFIKELFIYSNIHTSRPKRNSLLIEVKG